MLVIGLPLAAGRLSTNLGSVVHPEASGAASAAASLRLPKAASSIASYPDRGELLAYDRERQVRHSGASTWMPVQISEEHALRAIAAGGMDVRAPNGQTIHLRYERHVEHPDGNWTWVGREEGGAPGTETLLTFGEKAVFGTIRQGNADLSLTTEAGSTWLVETDRSRVATSGPAVNDDDFMIPASLPMAASGRDPIRAASVQAEQIPATAAAQAVASATVDIAVGYTTGFATRLGGESQAMTRLNFLVDSANQAYLNSGIDGRIRLVRAIQVDYPDGTNNGTTLFDLTGVSCTESATGAHYRSFGRWDCTPAAVPAALQPLVAARETYGADLLVLVRKFETSSTSCGVAWVLGGGQTASDSSNAAFGTSVVNDSSGDMFPDNGATCPDLHLAHELGHNMGQQHDVVTASGTNDSNSDGNLLDPEEYGRHPYSFGYSTDGTAADIATIMSVRRISQTRYKLFSNPRISACGGAPCGTVDQADNARSMNATMPIVATFRTQASPLQASVDLNGDGKSDLIWENYAQSWMAYWWMSGAAPIGSGVYSIGTPYRISATGDFDGDGRGDILWANTLNHTLFLWRSRGDGTFDSQYVAAYGGNWSIVATADLNGDGKSDLVWEDRAQGMWAYWWMNGSAVTASGVYSVGTAYRIVTTGDFDGDGRGDLLWSNTTGDLFSWRSRGDGTFDGAYVASYAPSWGIVGTADLNGDGKSDVLWEERAQGLMAYWLMSGSSPIGSGSYSVGIDYGISALGDFDGDNRDDIVWANRTNHTTYLWRSNGDGTFDGQYVASYGADWALLGRSN
ncbi:FG-GAP-like repeat-containing protein [Lysobacter terrae]